MPEKKSAKNSSDLPKGARQLKPNDDTSMYKDIGEKVVPLVDELMASPFQNHRSRPRDDKIGYYAICHWYPRFKSWAILYVGHGRVRSCLNHHVRGGQKGNALGTYLSSFNKEARAKLWFKWIKDPAFPQEDVDINDVIKVVQYRYNDGETPAFNADLPDLSEPEEEKLPEDFSIVPNWDKPKRRKADKPKSEA